MPRLHKVKTQEIFTGLRSPIDTRLQQEVETELFHLFFVVHEPLKKVITKYDRSLTLDGLGVVPLEHVFPCLDPIVLRHFQAQIINPPVVTNSLVISVDLP